MNSQRHESPVAREPGSFSVSSKPSQGETPPPGLPQPSEVVFGGLSSREPGVGQLQRALVKVTTMLYKSEVEALQGSLEKHFGFPLQLDVELDPEILGGVWVRVGDIVIDGSLSGQLEVLRHHLLSRCRVMLSSEAPPIKPESATA